MDINLKELIAVGGTHGPLLEGDTVEGKVFELMDQDHQDQGDQGHE